MLPDIPIWRDRGIHPFSTRAREHDTAAPILSATDSATSMSDRSLTPSPSEMRILADAMLAGASSHGMSSRMRLNVSGACCQ